MLRGKELVPSVAHLPRDAGGKQSDWRGFPLSHPEADNIRRQAVRLLWVELSGPVLSWLLHSGMEYERRRMRQLQDAEGQPSLGVCRHRRQQQERGELVNRRWQQLLLVHQL